MSVQVFVATCSEGMTRGLTTCMEGMKIGFESASKGVVEWGGYLVRELKNLPTVIHNHPFVEIGLIIAANALFFLAINEGLRRLNQWLENQEKPIKEDRKFAKQVVVNVILPGAAIVGFNALLSLAIPISGWLVVGMAVAAIAARLLLNLNSISERRTTENKN